MNYDIVIKTMYFITVVINVIMEYRLIIDIDKYNI